MADIQPQTAQAKRKVAKKKVKNKSGDVNNFANLSASQKWNLLAELLPQLVALLDEERA